MISISNITPIYTKNYTPSKNISFKSNTDSVSFTSTQKQNSSWHLKDETIKKRDPFSTTVERTTYKKGFLGIKKPVVQEVKLYDLPIRFAERIKNNGNSILNVNPPQDVLDASGLSQEEFLSEIGKINSIIRLTKPRYDLFEDKTKHEFQMKMGKTTAQISRVFQGESGAVYKLEVPNSKPLALKQYTNINNSNLEEGAFPELAFAELANQNDVKNIPHLYAGDPYAGWMLSEFITPDYQIRDNGISFIDYCSNNRLTCDDINAGIAIGTTNGKVFVDFGYIYPAQSSHELNWKFNQNTIQDKQEYYNNSCYLNNPNHNLLDKTLNMFIYGTKESQTDFYNQNKDTPEMRFYNNTVGAVEYIFHEMEIPTELQENLQESFEDIGGIGSAIDLVKAANQ